MNSEITALELFGNMELSVIKRNVGYMMPLMRKLDELDEKVKKHQENCNIYSCGEYSIKEAMR